ncbi:hypothetical protein [Paenibacillus sp. L3-i20]|uniref:hypothetical protein n=1 Tax=Paenibacillus sp. L3-i20 TaxID=2905833 RepID=UPI001EDFCE2D|nr:hypothetical protein [Paenibacillus sp. L3-i20]GKU77253.1 hypothetical protein L3i20_v216500 [Paenibacillus sp. L3-i20]
MNKFKRLLLPVTIVFAMSAAVPSVSAAPGQWDYIGEESVKKYGNTWDSGGGNWKVSSDRYNTVCVNFELWEYDPYDPNDYIGKGTICPGQSKVFNVSGFTDGGGQAELFVKKTSYTSTLTRLIYHD